MEVYFMFTEKLHCSVSAKSVLSQLSAESRSQIRAKVSCMVGSGLPKAA